MWVLKVFIEETVMAAVLAWVIYGIYRLSIAKKKTSEGSEHNE